MEKFALKNEDMKCAPSKKYGEGSCFTLDSLLLIANAYNQKCKRFKSLKPIVIQNDKRYLVKEITKVLSPVCSDQLCWLDQDFIKVLKNPEITKNTFRPKLTTEKYAWLSNVNITEVMEQYMSKYTDYKFMGCVPIDFDSIPQYGIKNMDLLKIWNEGIRKISFVFNLDESWQGGSHWVSLYVNLEKNQIYFFDSFGKRPVARIRELVRRISIWCYNKTFNKNIGIREFKEQFFDKNTKNFIERALPEIKYNKTVHQEKNSECGVYSLNAPLRLLNGETFDQVSNNILRDDEVNECRPVYFRFK